MKPRRRLRKSGVETGRNEEAGEGGGHKSGREVSTHAVVLPDNPVEKFGGEKALCHDRQTLEEGSDYVAVSRVAHRDDF